MRLVGLGILIMGSILILLCTESNAKTRAEDRYNLLLDTVVFADTNLHVNLDEINVKRYKKRKRKHYRSTRKYWRTVRNVRIVYPYAEEANNTIIRLNEQLKNVHSKKERRKLIRKEYKGLMKEYKKPLMKLKISQGKLLMKLIDRESGHSSYYHLKELKGSVTAVFWQSIAAMFGTSLKAEYDPLGKDWMVEEILDRIKNRELPPPYPLRTKRKFPSTKEMLPHT
ncbi:DUF4294 domain-containing protein [Marinifilum flexuosum]|uniref:Uncharacterized protein DUF4294 n=2 Tax=Marinifilum flexuosum TaxID=1117708 RepID=A0A419WWX9_9BACT|nr:DUF4294 domain-containing protein [Marinifilum flexuosum]RKD99992.1 uncharacterized protein DUF4294 [Marinifilum flexuosum]